MVQDALTVEVGSISMDRESKLYISLAGGGANHWNLSLSPGFSLASDLKSICMSSMEVVMVECGERK